MGKYKKILAVFLSLAMAAGTFGCAGKPGNTDAPQEGSGAQANAGESGSLSLIHISEPTRPY